MTNDRNTITLPLREGQFSTSSWVEANLDDTKMGYHSSIEFFNLTNKPLCIQDRLGVPQVIPVDVEFARSVNDTNRKPYKPLPHAVRGHGLCIVHSFSYHYEELQELIQRYSSYANTSVMYKKIVDALQVNLKNDSGWGKLRQISVTVSIKPEDIEASDVFYIQELGVVVSTVEKMGFMEHPESLPELQRIRCNNVVCGVDITEDPAFVSMKAYTTSKHKEYEHLYIEILGQVQQIPVIYNSTDDFNGIEVCCKRSVSTADGRAPLFTRYTFEEAFNTLMVATNVYDAANGDQRRKIEHDRKSLELNTRLKDQELELKQLSNEIARRKLDQDTLALEYKEKEEVRKQKYDEWAAELKKGEDERRRGYEERILQYKNIQLDKDIELKKLTEEYNRLRMRQDISLNDKKAGFEMIKSSMGLAGHLMGFMLQVLKALPSG